MPWGGRGGKEICWSCVQHCLRAVSRLADWCSTRHDRQLRAQQKATFMLLQDHHFITEAQWIIIKVSIQMARWMPVDLLSAAASTRVIKLLYTRPRDWPLTTHLQQYFTLSYLSAQCCLAHLLNGWLAELCMLKRISTQNMVTKSPDKAIYGRWIVNLNF